MASSTSLKAHALERQNYYIGTAHQAFSSCRRQFSYLPSSTYLQSRIFLKSTIQCFNRCKIGLHSSTFHPRSCPSSHPCQDKVDNLCKLSTFTIFYKGGLYINNLGNSRFSRFRTNVELEVASAVDVINDLGFDTLTFLCVTVGIIPVFRLLKVSPILGFFTAGVVLNQFGLIRNIIDVKVLSEWGILFLLFEMGLELSLARLKALAKFAFVLGLAQVCISKESSYLHSVTYYTGFVLLFHHQGLLNFLFILLHKNLGCPIAFLFLLNFVILNCSLIDP